MDVARQAAQYFMGLCAHCTSIRQEQVVQLLQILQQYITAQDGMGPADDLDNGGVLRFALAVNAFMYITIFISQDVDVS